MISLYRFFYALYFLLLITLGSWFSDKTKKLVQARLKIKPNRPPKTTKTFLIHAASGEAEYAFPIVKKLKEKHPQCFIIFTYFSTSYVHKIQEQRPGVDICLPLPFDFPGAVRSFLKIMQPDLVLISRTDLWPEFIHQCNIKKIPVVLFSRTQKPLGFLAKFFNRWVFNKLSLISTVSDLDAQNLKNILGAQSKTPVLVHGDTRWDQVFTKISPIKNTPFLNEKFFVAGSIWPEDFKALNKAWDKNWGKLILAPHEPTKEFITELRTELSAKGLKVLCYSQWKNQKSNLTDPSSAFDVLLIDELGLLYTTYIGAFGAFIGGSFKSKVHSVMESLATQTPVIVGPYYKNNREATIYKEVILPTTHNLTAVQVAKNAEDLKHGIQKLSDFYDVKTQTGHSFLNYQLQNPFCKDMDFSPTTKVLDSI